MTRPAAGPCQGYGGWHAAGAWTGLFLLGCTPPEPEADLLLLHGRVYTLDWADPDPDGRPASDSPFDPETGWSPNAEAVAVRQDRIVFVGSSRDAARFRGPSTEVIDLDGATVLPGLVDSHTHVANLGARLHEVDLYGVESEEDAVERVASRAAEEPAGTWIVGRGWDEGAWADRYPDRRLLSRRVPDHPVVLRGLHGFAAWANQAALDRAGITAGTPAPPGGEIRRDAEGRPSGILLNRAVDLLEEALPAMTPEALEERVLDGLREMSRHGFVAVHEAGVDTGLMTALESLERQGRLPLAVHVMLSARDESLSRAWLARGPDRGSGSMLRTRAVKAFYDGALGSRGARLLEDYADAPGHRGVSGAEYGFDEALVEELIRAGFQAAIHAIGDAGNRDALDFLERMARVHPPSLDLRHRIEHAQVVHPDDFARFGHLRVIASMQPPHMAEDKAWAEARLGPERVRGAYAWRTLRLAGAGLVFSSDLPGSDHDPFYGLHAAITRRDPGLQPPAGWYFEQRLTPEETVRAYTAWAARAAFQENEAGTIAPDRRADLTVMDTDPFVVGVTAPQRLLAGRILLTVVGGRIVHRELP